MNSEDIEQLKNEYYLLVVEERVHTDDLYWIKDRLEQIEVILAEYDEI